MMAMVTSLVFGSFLGADLVRFIVGKVCLFSVLTHNG